jgi:hypothetical protein
MKNWPGSVFRCLQLPTCFILPDEHFSGNSD